MTDSKPYTKMTVNPSAPTIEAVIPRVGADAAARSRAEAVRPPMLEPDTNRPGQDYKSLELTDPQPEVCQQACADDPKCKAFTYVKPGGQGPRAMCWLKSGVPAASKSDCCVSGVKPATTSGMVRPGAAAAIGLAAEVAPAADSRCSSPQTAARLSSWQI